MALDATTGGVNANSYITYAAAATIITQERGATDPVWTAAPQSTAEAALIWGCFLIDIGFDFYGAPTTLEQRLRNPRSGLYDIDGYYIPNDIIPYILLRANAEMGLYLLRRDRTKEPGLLGKAIKHAKLGPMEVSTELLDRRLDLIPSYIAQILSPIATLRPGGGRGGMVMLERI